jgi:hypothetical protein
VIIAGSSLPVGKNIDNPGHSTQWRTGAPTMQPIVLPYAHGAWHQFVTNFQLSLLSNPLDAAGVLA